jgi:hypothetical protein
VRRGAGARARRHAAVALACCFGAATIAACTNQSHLNEIIAALRLHRVGGGALYETPRGCRIEALLDSWTTVKVYRDDQRRTVFTNAPRTLGVKAVGLSPACKVYVRTRLRTLNPHPRARSALQK